MRYTHHRGLAAVTRWVRLKFAAMNLKKLAVWSWKNSIFAFIFAWFCPNYEKTPAFAPRKRGSLTSCPLSFSYEKESAVDGRKKESQRGELRRNKLHIPHPVRRLRRTGVVRSIVPPFPTRIAALDSRGSPVPFANPLKTTKKGAAAPFLGFSPEFGLCGDRLRLAKRATDASLIDRRGSRNTLRLFRLPYVKYSTGANKATRTAHRALGKPDWTAARRAFGRRTV